MRPTAYAYRLLGVTALCLGSAWPTPSRAELLTFELQQPGWDHPVPNGYGGFTWTHFNLLDGPTYPTPGSGYRHGVVSGRQVVFNPYEQQGRLKLRQPGTFTFDGAWLTAAWNNGLNITVEGWNERQLLYSRTVVVGPDAPTLFQFGYTGIDELRFRSFGGRDAGAGGGGTHFVMDDFSFSGVPPAVPEPATWGLLALGVAAVAGRARRREGRSPVHSRSHAH